MLINVSGRQVQLTPTIEDYVQKKCERLTRFSDRIQAIEVILDKVPHGFAVEVLADVEHHDDFIAKSEHDDLYTCVDRTLDKAARQLHDWKERLLDDRKNQH
ncbi:MAG: ribosome-associated translation inhibitor RaiA [Phycisphaerales bacterium]|nr:ribosome-associated translation inhibitor RaiA [Phycisphaerales bacterium]